MNSMSLKPGPLALLMALAIPTITLAAPLKKGDMIPDVEVRNEDNQELKLTGLVARKPTVLIFYRGGWCPFCTRHLSALVDIQDDLKAAGLQMVAISIVDGLGTPRLACWTNGATYGRAATSGRALASRLAGMIPLARAIWASASWEV